MRPKALISMRPILKRRARKVCCRAINKTREHLIFELARIQARMAAKEQLCQEQAQEIIRLKSLLNRRAGVEPIAGSMVEDTAERLDRGLAHQKELLQGIIDNIPVLLVMYEPRLKRFMLNRHAEAVLGWTTAHANQGDFMSKVYPDPAYRAEVAAYMQSLAPGWRELNVTTRDGGTLPSSWANIALSDETLIGIGVDLRERKRTVQALLESEERFRIMADGLPLIVWVHDAQGRQQFVNRTFLEFFGVSEEETKDGRWQLLMHPDDADAYSQAFEDSIRQRRPFHAEVRVQSADGQWRYIESFAKPRMCAAGEFHGFVGTSVDITERKRSEKALQTNTERLELLAVVAERLLRSENPKLVIADLCGLVLAHLDCQFFLHYLVGEPGRMLQLNAHAGFPEDAAGEIRTFDFTESISGCVAVDGQRVIAEDIQNSAGAETRVLKSYGMQAYCCHPLIVQETLIGSLAFGTNTRPTFAADEIALMKSISDQVAVALQRMQVEKSMRRLNQSLEHQVAERTALADNRAKQLQSLAVELIESEEKERQRVSRLLHDDLQQILASARFHLQAFSANLPAEPMLEKVEQMLAESIAKSRRLSHELCPAVLYHTGLVAALEWIVRQMNEQFGLIVQMTIDTVQPLAQTPLKVFVFRAVQELLFNIVKHAQVNAATIAITNVDAYLAVVVSDRGCGFNAAEMERSTAAGFGLLTIRERAHYIGGSLVIESTPGCGSRIELRVPLKIAKDVGPQDSLIAGKEKARMVAESADIETGQGIRVLFADDHKVIRAGMIRLMSSQPGIVVVGEAANGREALELAHQLRPDIVVMDIGMPEMDGIEATRRIKAQMPHVCVLGLSMLDHDQVITDMRRAGADAFISKSATSAELLKAIYELRRDFAENNCQR